MPSRTIEGYELSYAESGAGDPVVLVHGTLGDQRSWARQMEPLGERYHVMALSMRHCWPGDWTEGGDFTIDRHVADVAAFIRSLGADKVRLVGHSRGGHIAFRVAERHPELLRALVLAEPGGELDESLGGKPAAGRQAGAFAEAAAMVAAGDEEGGLKRVAEHTGGPGAWERRPEERKVISRANARTLLGQANEKRSPYSRAAAEAIRIPTLLVVGEKTLPNFVAIADALQKTIPGVERVGIPNAAHSMNYDNPGAFNAAVMEFFSRH
ncbi:alpha/beta hydrolase [Siccirubricoccus sp. KC 17139]|uniref:Alpha/beta hydrolase n=1 Tax=Siccirubricoccus soli TaxID=2899147 RepID=A0ABT1D6A0_9PROT|nr:alpha/beta hydrolase [Siccirubricoccus soli]MCO6416800.1 alpha/beta hydrolase [Siccirubricoccus soli]MCP2682935.1 alpha/beta hydrolase [Siccirubricoccus soli]